MRTYAVALTGPARRTLGRLPEKVGTAFVEFVFGSLAENPYRVGRRLTGELAGVWSARRGDYRVLYVVDDEADVGTVISIAHRADAYRPRE